MLRAFRVARDAYGSLLEIREELRLQRLSAATPVLRNREELPQLLNLRNLRGEGVEIGVQRATFSSHILRVWAGSRLYSIDPWCKVEDTTYVDIANAPDDAQEDVYLAARDRLAPFAERSVMLRMMSEEAAPRFAPGSLDFVYIDAQHHYEAVRGDLLRWFPKVRRGGLIGGHDYLDGDVRGSRFGVKRAVDEFAAERGLRIAVTLEQEYASWYCFVGER